MNTKNLKDNFIKNNPLSDFQKYKSKLLLGFCGVPGSGKTTIAKKISEKYKIIRIATDDLKIYFVDEGLPYEIVDLFNLQTKLIEFYLINGISVIIDSNSDKRVYQSQLADIGKKYGAKVKFIYCKISPEQAWKRIELRRGKANRVGNDFTMTKEKLLSFFKSLEKPKHCLEVDTETSLEICLESVFNRLNVLR